MPDHLPLARARRRLIVPLAELPVRGEDTLMRIACWQSGSSTDAAALTLRLRSAVSAAAEAGATLLITPEMSLTGYRHGPERLARVAEPADGRLRNLVGQLAAEAGLAIVYGWPEACGGAVFNAVQLIGRTGQVLAHYRKTHLYGDFDTASFIPGSTPVVQADVDGFRVGLLICYDVEFPELVRLHSLAGTQLLAVPTALVQPWTFLPRILVPARAFESQLFIAYVNWAGSESDAYCGLSRVIGPDGAVIAADETGAVDTLLIADLDPEAIAVARKTTPYLLDRRPELYGGIA